MKRKGIIFIILILVLVMGIMPLSSHAQNGSIVLSFSAGQQTGTTQFTLDKTIYGRDEIISIDSSFDRISEGMQFFLWKNNNTSTIYNTEYTIYKSFIDSNKVYESSVYTSNGNYTIDLNSIKSLDTGNYVVSLVCAEKRLIYDYYIVITGSTYAIGSPSEYANYVLNMKVITDTGSSYNVITDQIIDSDSSFTHSGKALLSGNSLVTLQTTLRSVKENRFANAYVISFKGLRSTWDTVSNAGEPGYYSPLTFCVSIKNKNGTYILGYINNVNSYNGDYDIYLPAEYVNGLDTSIDTADDVTIVLNDVSSRSYDYYFLSWENIDVSNAYILDLDPDKNAESLGALEDAGDALGNVEKPEVDLDDLDINNYVDEQSLNDLTYVLTVFYNNEIYLAMIMLVISLAVIAYIFFGKR